MKGYSLSANPTQATLERETLELMRLTARTEEVGDCLIWTGALSSPGDNGAGRGGYPIIRLTHGHACKTVRRVIVELFGDKDGRRDLAARQPVETTCGDRLCIAQDHLVISSPKKVGKRAAKAGKFSSIARSAKISAARRGHMKLTADQAAEIRVSNESGPVLAERYGVNRSLINGIKRGDVWRDYSSPFAGLGAR